MTMTGKLDMVLEKVNDIDRRVVRIETRVDDLCKTVIAHDDDIRVLRKIQNDLVLKVGTAIGIITFVATFAAQFIFGKI